MLQSRFYYYINKVPLPIYKIVKYNPPTVINKHFIWDGTWKKDQKIFNENYCKCHDMFK